MMNELSRREAIKLGFTLGMGGIWLAADNLLPSFDTNAAESELHRRRTLIAPILAQRLHPVVIANTRIAHRTTPLQSVIDGTASLEDLRKISITRNDYVLSELYQFNVVTTFPELPHKKPTLGKISIDVVSPDSPVSNSHYSITYSLPWEVAPFARSSKIFNPVEADAITRMIYSIATPLSWFEGGYEGHPWNQSLKIPIGEQTVDFRVAWGLNSATATVYR